MCLTCHKELLPVPQRLQNFFFYKTEVMFVKVLLSKSQKQWNYRGDSCNHQASLFPPSEQKFLDFLWLLEQLRGGNIYFIGVIFFFLHFNLNPSIMKARVYTGVSKSANLAEPGAVQRLTKSSRWFLFGHCWCWKSLSWETFIIH